ncbi:MAG: HAD family hydrolase [Oscillospiraceae bacterium]|jgi:hypothetical protein|nr:HAD family hydrolase [Oscillospiraceae bacterium]
MRGYDVIFFDWDGTAVVSRNAPADDAAAAMSPLLEAGVRLAVISGASREKISADSLAKRFSPQARSRLYMGLGRGADNYCFDKSGKETGLGGVLPGRRDMAALHRTCYQIHEFLYLTHSLNSDIVFCRDNYCKIDLLPDVERGEKLYMREAEVRELHRRLLGHGFTCGIRGLTELVSVFAKENKITLCATTDAKYLEVGFGTKADSVDTVFTHLEGEYGIKASDCCFWGDEYLEIGGGIFGSDAQMITQKTKEGSFFDVSDAAGVRPAQVRHLGGGPKRFLSFLKEQRRLLQ